MTTRKPGSNRRTASDPRIKPIAASAALLAALMLAGCSGGAEAPDASPYASSPGASATSGAASGRSASAASPSAAPTAEASPSAAASVSPSAAPPAAAASVVFSADKTEYLGFADETQTKLLLLDPGQVDAALLKRFEAMDTAIGGDGQLLRIRYAGKQAGNEQASNGRENTTNFANLAGYVFDVTDGKPEMTDSYYLTDSRAFDLTALKAVKPVPEARQGTSAGIDGAKKRAAADKKRAVARMWQLADIGDDEKLYLIEFARQKDDALASLALQRKDGTLVYRDYPATYNEMSTWRVDDGGEMSPRPFLILFAAETPSGTAVALSWYSSEMVDDFILAPDGPSDVFKEIPIVPSRYISP